MMLEIFSQLKNLKKKRNAIILAHYYQDPDIQDVADFMGDSLTLAQQAANTDGEVILFCSVHFMCETAKILNPGKRVILPDMNAGCSLADSAPEDKFKKWVEALDTIQPEIHISEDLRLKALKPLERMLALS